MMGGPRISRRKAEELVFKGLMKLATLIVVGCLLLIVFAIITKGLPAMRLSMITQTPKGGYYFGKEGGILNAITGSLCLGAGATVLAALVSLPIVLYLNAYVDKRSKLATWTRFTFDVLWGIPSIVYGAFGFTLMLFLGMRASLLAGIITVGLLEIPIMARAIDEIIKIIPGELHEASYSLGATKLETALRVVVRQALPGILTAMLIAFGRGVGDAASVMFTAGFTDQLPSSLNRPVATLPLAIFYQLGTPVPEVQQRAYASAFILTLLILAVSLGARLLSRRYSRFVIR
jgi:phosphate transport system permease protein